MGFASALTLLLLGGYSVEVQTKLVSRLPSTQAYLRDFELANAAFEDNRHVEAAQLYTSAIAQHPDFPEAYRNLGVTLSGLGGEMLHGAVKAHKAAVQLRPDSWEFQFRLGMAYGVVNDVPNARKSIGAAAKLNPTNAEVIAEHGVYLWEEGRTEEAIKNHKRLVKISPRNALAYSNLAAFFLNAHQAHKEAAFYYGHCVALQPSNAEVYHNLGQIEMRLNQHPSAIRSLEAATRLRPVWAEAYFNKGLACGRKSHTGAVAFQTATQLEPNHAEAYFQLGKALDLRNQLASAAAAFLYATASRPDHTEAYYSMGVALYKDFKPSYAMNAYRQVTTPTQCQPMLRQAVACFVVGHCAEPQARWVVHKHVRGAPQCLKI